MHKKNFIGAVFNSEDDAHSIVREMIDNNYPMDQVSILHKAGGQGDDFLGIAYTDEKERFKVWGEKGALWGALGGLLAGIGMVSVPGIGPIVVAGPIIEAIAGAVAGAGLMTAGAAATHLTIALRRLGIAEEKLDALHQAVMDGKTVLLVNLGNEDPQEWQNRFKWEGAEPVIHLP